MSTENSTKQIDFYYEISTRGMKEWYADIPEYIEQGGDKGELEMVSGADMFLEYLSFGTQRITVSISTEPIDGSILLVRNRELEEEKESTSGGWYIPLYEEEPNKFYKEPLWLCPVTEFIFGNIPDEIYIKRIR